MKRIIILFLPGLAVMSCSDRKDFPALEKRISVLEKKLDSIYKPGFGVFMSAIQNHHEKLWFAGQNQNWELAEFEVHEIRETAEDIKKYKADRNETKMLEIIFPALDSVNDALKEKSSSRFQKAYIVLTNTCNECHRSVNFGYNVIKIPEEPAFSNQEFRVTPQAGSL